MPGKKNNDPHPHSAGHGGQVKFFKYVGDTSLIVIGAATGKVYHFRYHGEHVPVDYADAFAIMAEKDVQATTA